VAIDLETVPHLDAAKRAWCLVEANRVLRPGGDFLYADLRPCESVAEWETALAGAPMRMVSHENINAQVLRGMEINTQRILELIDRVPRYLRPISRAFVGIQGSPFYRAMQRGKYSFRMYRFSRVEASDPAWITSAS